jgi:hypothetical protein
MGSFPCVEGRLPAPCGQGPLMGRVLSHDPLGGQLEDSWKKQWVTLGSADTWRVLV